MDSHAAGSKRSRQKNNQSKADLNNATVQMFEGYRNDLDARHDKHERIVKLSRDITIGSKRTIFLLHRYSGSENKNDLLAEALQKIQDLQKDKFIHIAQELENEDPYQFLRGYSAGLQEYIEALSFYHYLRNKRLVSLEEVQKDLCFQVQANSDCAETAEKKKKLTDLIEESSVESVQETTKNQTTTRDSLKNCNIDKQETPEGSKNVEIQKTVTVHLPPMEYMLGLGDLTGELMRLAINSVGLGNLETPAQVCKFLRQMEQGFVSFGNVSRELNRKITTLKQSLQKVEAVCYTIQVRGSEIPKHMLVDMLSTGPVEPSVFSDDHHSNVED